MRKLSVDREKMSVREREVKESTVMRKEGGEGERGRDTAEEKKRGKRKKLSIRDRI